MYLPPSISYLYQIAALTEPKIPEGGDIFGEHPIAGVQIFVDLLVTLTGSGPLNIVVSVLDDGDKTPVELRDGLQKISDLINTDANAKTAFKKILGDLYLGARQEGAKVLANKVKKMVEHTRI